MRRSVARRESRAATARASERPMQFSLRGEREREREKSRVDRRDRSAIAESL